MTCWMVSIACSTGLAAGALARCSSPKARIVYSPWFKRDCLKRYRAGESATRLFRAAGLPPELVGQIEQYWNTEIKL